MWFADTDGVFETVASYMTLMTDLFRPELAGRLLFLPFSM
jgi:hypothetical protein